MILLFTYTIQFSCPNVTCQTSPVPDRLEAFSSLGRWISLHKKKKASLTGAVLAAAFHPPDQPAWTLMGVGRFPASKTVVPRPSAAPDAPGPPVRPLLAGHFAVSNPLYLVKDTTCMYNNVSL